MNSSREPVTIACIQMASKPYDSIFNRSKAAGLIEAAANKGATICVLPELFVPGYSTTDEVWAHAESIDGDTITFFLDLARSLQTNISGSFLEVDGEDFYNTMFFTTPDGLAGTYRKTHIPMFENKYWTGGMGGRIIETKLGNVGFGICYDIQFPDVWRGYAGNVDLILICSAWPDCPPNIKMKYVRHDFELLKSIPQKISRVLGVPVIYCNATHRCLGKLPFNLGCIDLAGYSKIIQDGVVVASLDGREEGTIMATVNVGGDRQEPDKEAFDGWVKYSFSERFPHHLATRVIPWFLRNFHYKRKKKSALNLMKAV